MKNNENKEQHKFTIPKDIVSQLNNINASEYENLVDRFIEDYEDYSLSEKLIEFSSKNPYNYHLCILYLVGEELGKRMVEVVEWVRKNIMWNWNLLMNIEVYGGVGIEPNGNHIVMTLYMEKSWMIGEGDK